MSLKKELQVRILDHPDIEEKKSKFSADSAFFVGKKEVAHFHKGNELDLRLTKAEIKRGAWIKDPRVSQETKNSDWVQLRFKSEKEFPFLLQLISIAVKANL